MSAWARAKHESSGWDRAPPHHSVVESHPVKMQEQSRKTKNPPTHPNMVILSAGGESIRLGSVVLLLAWRWTRLLHGRRLEIARRDGLAIMPPDLKGAEAHRWLADCSEYVCTVMRGTQFVMQSAIGPSRLSLAWQQGKSGLCGGCGGCGCDDGGCGKKSNGGCVRSPRALWGKEEERSGESVTPPPKSPQIPNSRTTTRTKTSPDLIKI